LTLVRTSFLHPDPGQMPVRALIALVHPGVAKPAAQLGERIVVDQAVLER